MANILLLPANHHVEFEISPKDPKNKIDVNHSTKDGATALILAVQNSDFPTTKLLLDHGGDPNQRNSNGHNAFSFCRKDPEMNEFIKKHMQKQKSHAATVIERRENSAHQEL